MSFTSGAAVSAKPLLSGVFEGCKMTPDWGTLSNWGVAGGQNYLALASWLEKKSRKPCKMTPGPMQNHNGAVLRYAK